MEYHFIILVYKNGEQQKQCFICSIKKIYNNIKQEKYDLVQETIHTQDNGLLVLLAEGCFCEKEYNFCFIYSHK